MNLIYKFKKLFNIGLIGYIKCTLRKRKLKKLQKSFNFSNWHFEACFECRPYKKQILNIANQIAPETIVDIGCGLGEILSKTKAKFKYGIDPDFSVIKAAEYLHPNIKFYHGNSEFMYEIIDSDCVGLKRKSFTGTTQRLSSHSSSTRRCN